MKEVSLPKIVIDWQIADRRWMEVRGLKSKLQQAAQAVFVQLSIRPLKLNVSVLCTNDKAIKKLNLDFRGMDKPTNVLAFPQLDSKALRRFLAGKEPVFLGDVVLGYQYIVAEAKKDHKILINHLSHLMIHAILHLLGYDHLNDQQANRMERLEKKIMLGLGYSDPYAEITESSVKKVSRQPNRKNRTPKTKMGRIAKPRR